MLSDAVHRISNNFLELSTVGNVVSNFVTMVGGLLFDVVEGGLQTAFNHDIFLDEFEVVIV